MAKNEIQKKGGRPTALTESVVQKLEQAFSIGANDSQACAYAGISRQTYYSHLAKDTDFKERCEFLKQKLPLEAKNQLVQLIKSGDRQSILWYLDRIDRQAMDETRMTSEAQLFEEIKNKELDRLREIRIFKAEELDRLEEYASAKAEACMLRAKVQMTGATLISDKTGGSYTNPVYTQLQGVLARMDKLRDKLFPAGKTSVEVVRDIRDEFI